VYVCVCARMFVVYVCAQRIHCVVSVHVCMCMYMVHVHGCMHICANSFKMCYNAFILSNEAFSIKTYYIFKVIITLLYATDVIRRLAYVIRVLQVCIYLLQYM